MQLTKIVNKWFGSEDEVDMPDKVPFVTHQENGKYTMNGNGKKEEKKEEDSLFGVYVAPLGDMKGFNFGYEEKNTFEYKSLQHLRNTRRHSPANGIEVISRRDVEEYDHENNVGYGVIQPVRIE